MTEVLLAGESATVVEVEISSRNVLQNSRYEETADEFVETLEDIGASVTYQPSHVATEAFPRSHDALNAYDLVLLSDIGADSLQLTERVRGGKPDIDRCALLDSWVRRGGALGMIGGYMSFSGKNGAARYGDTLLADTLPVELQKTDDRVETPAGVVPETASPLAEELPDEWPAILGYNRLTTKSDSEVWATVNDDPLLVVGDHDEGSVFAYATDCAPHWASQSLLKWEGVPVLWKRLLNRVT